MGFTWEELNKYNHQMSDDVKKLQQNRTDYANKLANYGDFQFANQKEREAARNAYLNHGKFSYDINGDALYQQYKENYINQGKQAMMDTMGQATAMTGGYGNSYAATVGNQTYQGYLQNLNNMIPQLQQMALDRYNAERQRLGDNLATWNEEYDRQFNEHELGRNNIKDLLSYYTDAYNTEARLELDDYNNKFTADNDAIKYKNDTRYQVYRDGIEDERYAEKTKYEKEQDAIANDIAKQQLQAQMNTAKIAGYQAGATYDKDGNVIGVATPTEVEEFSRYVYAGVNEENGKSIFYKDGEKYEFDAGINPYGAGTNPDAKNGTFKNGYQPDNIKGDKLTWTNEWSDDINGVTQKVWQTSDGKKWLWDGTKGRYVKHNG